METLRRMLNPRGVAIVGASRDPTKRGYQAVVRLIEDRFEGEIYPVNPQAGEVAGLTTYPTVLDIPGRVDLALIVTPAERVPGVIRRCGVKGIPGAVVVAAGFRETGERGRELEEELVAVAREAGVRLIGPNTSGVFNLPARLNLAGIPDVPRGPIGLLSQSGNVTLGLLTEARLHSSLGFSSYVGVGNEADVQFHEYLAYLREDPHTAVVIIYAEGFRNGRAFLQEARQTVPETPVVIHKAGRSEAGRRAAGSHTGALATDPGVTDLLLRQAGVVSIRRSDQLFAAAEVLALQPPLRGSRVAVLADGGGHATMAADALAEYGIELTTLTDATRRRLAELLPPAASVRNPVDVAGGADRDPALFAPVLEAIFADPHVDGVLLVGLFGGYAMRFATQHAPAEEATAEAVTSLAAHSGKALVVQSAYAGHKPPVYQTLYRGGVPVHESIDVAARCISVLAERGNYLRTASTRSSFVVGSPAARSRLAGEHGLLPEHRARELLEGYGAPVAPWRLARSPEDAAAAAEEWGRRVALKVVSADVAHKSDVGGVMLNLTADEALAGYEAVLRRVTAALPGARIEGVLVSPMAERGVEMIVGMVRDPTFGPVAMTGLGGVLVELLGEVSFRALPPTELEIGEMLDELSATRMLGGFRGSEAVNRKALVELILTVSTIAQAEPSISAIDLNPVILTPDSATIVDARVIVGNDLR